MKKSLQLGVALLLALTVAACAPVSADKQQPAASNAPELTRVEVCSSATGLTGMPIAYASKFGLFAKYGLDVTLNIIEGGSDAVVALIADESSICQISGSAVVNAALAGEGIVFVAGVVNRQIFWLLVRPEIETAADLKGKAVAVTEIGGSADASMRAMLQAMGLQPDVDVTIVATGGSSTRMAALESGQVAGTVFALPDSAQAENAGYHVLFSPSQLDMEYQGPAIVTKRSFIAGNRSIVVAFIKALTEAMVRMKVDPDGAKIVMAEVLEFDPSADAALLDLSYERFVAEFLPDRPYPTEAGIQSIIDSARAENPSAADLTAADMIDASIVDELEQSGFIDGLTQK